MKKKQATVIMSVKGNESSIRAAVFIIPDEKGFVGHISGTAPYWEGVKSFPIFKNPQNAGAEGYSCFVI